MKEPKNLQEAINILYNNLSDEDKETIKDMSKDSFMGQAHHGLGRTIRNEWNLWKEDSELSKWFNEELDIQHADDKSGLILEGLWSKIYNVPHDIEGQVKRYHEHWKKWKS